MTLLMYFLLLLIVGALLFLVASLVFGRGEEMAPMHPDVSPVALPTSRPVAGTDLRRMRLSVVVRGYRMSEVDWVLDEVADQLDARDREIERLRDERDRAMQAAITATPRPDVTPDVTEPDADADPGTDLGTSPATRTDPATERPADSPSDTAADAADSLSAASAAPTAPTESTESTVPSGSTEPTAAVARVPGAGEESRP